MSGEQLKPQLSPSELVSEIVGLMQLAYAEGFRDGVKWWPDSYVGTSHARGIDYANTVAETMAERVGRYFLPSAEDSGEGGG